MARKIIIDTDPGCDDAIAILLAGRHLDVVGITTVFGNQSIEKTTRNALQVLEFSHLTHIPVYRGCAHPLIHEPRYASAVHGDSGLEGPDLPEPITPIQPQHAVDFIIDTVMTTPKVSLVPIGPLTNIAMALRKAPDIAPRIEEISLMGGSTDIGNATAAAEFNIWDDPEAAEIVFASGVPIKMVGLNLTMQAAVTPERRARIRVLGNQTGRIAADILDGYSQRLEVLFGVQGGSMHDACAVAWLIDPSLIQSEKMHVAIELNGTHTRGMTVCDRRIQGNKGKTVPGGEGLVKGAAPNAEVGLHLDVERFFDLLIETIGLYP